MNMNIGKHGEATRFGKMPQNINKKGRPKKTVNSVLKELDELGSETVEREAVMELYLRLVNSTEDELKSMVEDKDCNMLTRITIKHILSKKGFDIIEKFLIAVLAKTDQQDDKKDGGTNINVTFSKRNE